MVEVLLFSLLRIDAFIAQECLLGLLVRLIQESVGITPLGRIPPAFTLGLPSFKIDLATLRVTHRVPLATHRLFAGK